jgi:hypothetical protein
MMCDVRRVKQGSWMKLHTQIGLVRTINVRCIYGTSGREITIYGHGGVCIRFWPTLHTIHIHTCTHATNTPALTPTPTSSHTHSLSLSLSHTHTHTHTHANTIRYTHATHTHTSCSSSTAASSSCARQLSRPISLSLQEYSHYRK